VYTQHTRKGICRDSFLKIILPNVLRPTGFIVTRRCLRGVYDARESKSYYARYRERGVLFWPPTVYRFYAKPIGRICASPPPPPPPPPVTSHPSSGKSLKRLLRYARPGRGFRDFRTSAPGRGGTAREAYTTTTTRNYFVRERRGPGITTAVNSLFRAR